MAKKSEAPKVRIKSEDRTMLSGDMRPAVGRLPHMLAFTHGPRPGLV